MKRLYGQAVSRKLGVALGILLLTTVSLASSGTGAQLMTIQFLNGRNGKPIKKGVRIWVYFNNDSGRQMLDLHTDGQGSVQFDANGAKTFQASPVGFVPCGEQPVGSSPRDYPVDEILKTGMLTQNSCSHDIHEPLRGKLLYFVRPATGWELFRN